MSSKRVTRSKYGNAISFFFLALMGVFIALPIYYSIINAFKPVSELFLFPPRFVVYHPTFENFKNIIRLQSQSTIAVERYIFNSVTVTVIATAGYINCFTCGLSYGEKRISRQENYICCNCFCDSFQCGCYRAAKVYDDVKIRNARYLLGNSAAGYGWVVWCFFDDSVYERNPK